MVKPNPHTNPTAQDINERIRRHRGGPRKKPEERPYKNMIKVIIGSFITFVAMYFIIGDSATAIGLASFVFIMGMVAIISGPDS